MKNSEILKLLKDEMIVAMGCTEPAASALAGNKAAELLGCDVESVRVRASRDMIKNTMGVGIPNCDMRGIRVAVLLGVFSECETQNLSILSAVTEKQKDKAKKLLDKTELVLEENVPPVYVKVELKGGGNSSSAAICVRHDCFCEFSKNGKILYERREEAENKDSEKKAGPDELSLERIIDFSTHVPQEDVKFVSDAARMNYDLAKYSVENDYGLCIARNILADMPEKPQNMRDAMSMACAYAAAASDARMQGCAKPVVINSGSGNQGITCTVPLIVLAEYLKSDEKLLTEALCISELVGIMITEKKNRLSALCGAFTAAIGAGCGIIHLLGGSINEMNLVIRNMVANLSGIVCDGAKNSCALKIYSSLDAACLSVKMAMSGSAPGEESGIVGADGMQSIDNLMAMCRIGMVKTDHSILDIMLDKEKA